MPRPHERSKPLGLDAKTKLLGCLRGHAGKMLDADPTHTFHIREALESAARSPPGQDLSLTQPWLHTNPPTGTSLAERCESLPVGGMQMTVKDRWDNAFQTKKGKRMLQQKDGPWSEAGTCWNPMAATAAACGRLPRCRVVFSSARHPG